MNICQVFLKILWYSVMTSQSQRGFYMARSKCKRTTSYQPACTKFFPEKGLNLEPTILLAEEVEALYLMDILELYQEEAAVKMNVSRPTFTRILRSARQKVTRSILGGIPLELQTYQEEMCIAFCSDANEFPYTTLHPRARYLQIVHLKNSEIVAQSTLPNPLFAQQKKPSIHLVSQLIEEHVHLFITGNIGYGLKSMLASKGIQLLIKKEFTTPEDIFALCR